MMREVVEEPSPVSWATSETRTVRRARPAAGAKRGRWRVLLQRAGRRRGVFPHVLQRAPLRLADEEEDEQPREQGHECVDRASHPAVKTLLTAVYEATLSTASLPPCAGRLR